MAIDLRRARRALRVAGARRTALLGLSWPLGRLRRVQALIRQRRAVLEAKNNVLGFLARTQGPLAEFELGRLEHVEAALKQPAKRRLILAAGASREMVEDELSSRHGSETGRSLDQALSELVADGLVLEVPAEAAAANHDIYLIADRRDRPHYDVAELTRLLQEESQYGTRLRQRARREAATKHGRTYRL